MTNNFISNETPIVGKLSIISMKGCEGITAKIDEYLRAFRGYEDTETYVTHVTCPRFGTGEGKCVIDETVRGHDVYIICDVFNYGVTYKMYGVENHMSPDDHYQDLKRVIAAMGGKARRVTVVMPMLYEGRQHRRNGRESLDAALIKLFIWACQISLHLTHTIREFQMQFHLQVLMMFKRHIR